MEANKGQPLNAEEVVISCLGESKEFWDSFRDVGVYIQIQTLLFTLYKTIAIKPQRKVLQKILKQDVANLKTDKETKVRHLGENVKRGQDVFKVPQDLRWQSTRQYNDALEIATYIHPDSEVRAILESWERIFKIYFFS